MRLPYALVLESICLLKSYSSAEMTAMVNAGSQFAKPSVAVRWRFFEYFNPGSPSFLWVSNRCRLVMPKGSNYQILIEFNGRIPNSAGKAETARKPSLTAVAVLTAPRHSLPPSISSLSSCQFHLLSLHFSTLHLHPTSTSLLKFCTTSLLFQSRKYPRPVRMPNGH